MSDQRRSQFWTAYSQSTERTKGEERDKIIYGLRIFVEHVCNNFVGESLCPPLLVMLKVNLLCRMLFHVSSHRDTYVTTDVISIAPEVSGPLTFLIEKDNVAVDMLRARL